MNAALRTDERIGDIHFRHVPYSVINELAVKLEPHHANNWIKLAEKIAGFTYEQVLYFETKRGEKDCTERLFEEYVKKENATVGKVKTALEEMERLDALEVLNKHMPEIERRHYEEKNKTSLCQRHPDENSYSWTSVSGQGGGVCSSCCPLGGHITHAVTHCHVGVCHPHESPPISHHSAMPRPPGPPCNGFPGPNSHSYTHHPYFSGHYHTPVSRSESLEVHNDIGGHRDISMEVEMVDDVRLEDGVPLDQGILRGENQLTSYSITHPPESMGKLGAIDVGREEVVKTTGDEAGYIYLNNKTGQVGRPSYLSQQSEESNSKQPVSQKRVAYFTKKIVNNGDPHPSSPPISKLQRLANLPPEFQPAESYKHFVADQKVEDGQEAKCRPVKEEKPDFPNYPYNQDNFLNFKNRPAPKSKHPIYDNISNTFPRHKAHTSPGPVVSNLRGSQSNTLTKSTSMPVDMKPAEFRKAWRYIKVFVTYSNDGKKHLQRVLSLCNCLVKNGFSCCVDINSRYVSTLPNQYDKVNWYKEKFKESDFILVCPSPKYKMEIETQETARNAPVPENQLHTRYIYRLMRQEYEMSGKNTRFVPVLFDGVNEELLPSWLQASLIYKWPSQFKDLLWMLTRPEDRIKPSARLFSESSSQSSSPHRDTGY